MPPPGVGPGSHLAPPPFLQTATPGAAAPASNDPFSQAVTTRSNEVRLVIDEKPVDDAEVGRKTSGRTLTILAGAIVLGSLIGYGAGSTMADRKQYNAAVRDGRDVYDAVRKASDTVNKAKALVDKTVAKAAGGSGAPGVAYDAIEELRALKKPFDAQGFARKRYSAFKPETVDALFEYYNKVNLLWSRIETLAARTLSEKRKAELDRAANAAGEMATSLTGCVPSNEKGNYSCNLVYVTLPPNFNGETWPDKVGVSTKRRGASSEKTVYKGQALGDDADKFVIVTNTAKSVSVLGQQANVFAEYQQDLVQLKTLLDGDNGIVAVQGRLERELGDIARLNEVFAF